MRQYLIPEEGSFYKANLHCHTTISDGRATPEQVKEIYKNAGYSVVAFTDHNIMVPHPELADPDFLPLNGVEYNINDEGYPGKDRDVKTCHLCFVALSRDVKYQVAYTDAYVKHGAARDFIPKAMIDWSKPDFKREYSIDCINEMIRLGREAGFFVTYNHPSWSQENYETYSKLKGLSAMEIANYDCIVEGYDDYNSREYRDMLLSGQRIFPVGADDNHNKYPVGHPHCDSLGAWVMIKAEKLEYDCIGKALEKGDFYASMGPEIKSLWFEDGKFCVDCSDAVVVELIAGVKKCQSVPAVDGEIINHAEFTVKPNHKWFRIRVRDAAGRYADTRAYYVDELQF